MRCGSASMKKIFLYGGVLIIFSCAKPGIQQPLVHILETSEEKAIRAVVDSLESYELQIHYTHIQRSNGNIAFTDYTFQEDDSLYFYPASTVKLPVAVLALEKLSRTPDLDLNTRFYIEGDTLETTFTDEVIKVFAISDNEANNRLFEFLGQDEINKGLESKGVGPVRISHRLSTPNADDVVTKPLVIYLNDSTSMNSTPSINAAIQPLHMPGTIKGRGYIIEDSLVQEPFDFSLKNYYPLRIQHEVLKRVIFPEVYEATERFQLGEEERKLLLKTMSAPPRIWGYQTDEYYDSYGKFFIYGDTKSEMPDHIKIYNKVGYAYGTLTDCAYIKDSNNNVEFMLSATILVNHNQIFNDDQYEYESIGIPFLAALGREIYQLELNHK